MRRKLFMVVCVSAVIVIAACAAGPNPVVHTPDGNGDVAGFWTGIWQGFICLFAFIISLFSDHVRIYEVHNTGNWYNFGFLIGCASFFGGCGVVMSG